MSSVAEIGFVPSDAARVCHRIPVIVNSDLRHRSEYGDKCECAQRIHDSAGNGRH